MSKLIIKCDFCGEQIERYPSRIKKFNFCGRKCLGDFSSKEKNPQGYSKLKDLTGVSEHMKKLNKELNSFRMTEETRAKLRQSRLGTGQGKSYEKIYGRHKHRIVAEQKLGRPLKTGEVVHHMDGNKRNNRPENLYVFPSQTEHAAAHKRWDSTVKKYVFEEVVPNEF